MNAHPETPSTNHQELPPWLQRGGAAIHFEREAMRRTVAAITHRELKELADPAERYAD